jgi:hypothetical protein
MNLSYKTAVVAKVVGPVNGPNVDCREHAKCVGSRMGMDEMYDQANSLQEFSTD